MGTSYRMMPFASSFGVSRHVTLDSRITEILLSIIQKKRKDPVLQGPQLRDSGLSQTPKASKPQTSQQNPCPFWVIIPPVNPLDDYSYTPPYTSPTISPLLPHYQYQYRNNRLPHPYKRIIPILPTTIPQISPLLPHYQDQYRNNQLPHPYALRWYYHPKVGKGSLIDFTRFSFKGYNHDILIVQCLLYSMFIIYL